ncbi:MAG: DNA polymerase I [Candidatus Omnitrophota bacterium]|jgi:DNA polymerase-1
MSEPRLFLIDATAFCYRAFYAVRGLSTSFGQPTNAIYGFINMLNKVLKEHRPEFLAVCFDVSRDTFRTKKFAEYKIQRPPMPDELGSQIPLIKEIVASYGIAIVEREGYEADDIIATLSSKSKKKGIPVTIVSSDKDMLQLVDEDIIVFSPYKDEGTFYDREKVIERFGVGPERITDIIALMGDSVDNIPGVPGIGEKTALGLIKEFGSLESLLGGIEKIKSEKIKSAVNGNIEQIKLNKELAVLDNGIGLEFEPEKLKIKDPDNRELVRLFKRLEFKKFLKELGAEEDERAPSIEAVELEDKDLKDILKPQDELILYGDNIDNLVFYAKDKVRRVKSPGANFKRILADPGIRKTGYDLKLLKVSLESSGIGFEGLYFDIMVAAYLVNPSRPGYALNDLALEYSGVLSGPAGIGAADALSVIRELRPRLEDELGKRSLLRLFEDTEMPLVSVLARMEATGIKIDLKMLDGLSKDLEKRLIKLIEEIYEISGCQFNINSPKQLRDILFERLKLPVVKRSKTGPSTDEEVLRKLADRHELPAMLLEYRQLMKLKSTYIDALPQLVDKKTGRIHTSFNQTVTETGRLSSSNPNLQNLPVKTELGRNIRKAVVAFDKDSLLLSCDYSQVELRVLAHLSKDSNLISAFMEGKDIHRITASLIYGLNEDDISEPMRESAKRVNFGIIYGLTSYGLSRDLKIGIDEAQVFIEAYFSRYPQVKDYLEGQIHFAREEGFVSTMLGRRRYLPEINNKNQGIRQFAERQAVNTPIQGSASDLIKLAMIRIDKQIRREKMKSVMIIQVHDELVFNMVKGEEKEFIGLVRRGMEEAIELDIPLKVDIKRGRNWSEMEEVK